MEGVSPDVLKELPPGLSGKTGKSAVGDVLGNCNEPGQIQADRWVVRDEVSIVLRWAQLTSSVAVREDTRECCVALATEGGRAVADIICGDVKKAFDRAALKAMRLQSLSPVSMALISAIWCGSCMKARLQTVYSNKVQTSRGLLQGAQRKWWWKK